MAYIASWSWEVGNTITAVLTDTKTITAAPPHMTSAKTLKFTVIFSWVLQKQVIRRLIENLLTNATPV